MSNKDDDEMPREQAVYFRNRLRAAREVALSDSEGYQQILFAIEQIGRQWRPQKQDLGKLQSEFTELVEKSHPLNSGRSLGIDFEAMFEMVREGRNDAMHVGSVARFLTGCCVKLSIMLEDAFMANEGTQKIEDYMVCNPVRTYAWQRIALIRQTMLENSFSCLPFLRTGTEGRMDEWHIVSSDAICRYLGANMTCRKSRMMKQLCEVIRENHKFTSRAEIAFPDSSIECVINKIRGVDPVLVIRRNSIDLIGIVNAFDLM